MEPAQREKEDLNIHDWTVGELLHLLQLDPKDVSIPLIDARVDASISKAKLNLDQTMVNFLLSVRTKLVNTYSTEAQGKFNKIVGNEIKDIHGDSAPERPPGNKFVSTFNLPVVTGVRNPVLRNTLNKLLFINSAQRPILSSSSSSFSFTLRYPLRRITSMSLDTLTLPSRIPNIGDKLGNAFFRIVKCADLPDAPSRTFANPANSTGLGFIENTDIAYLATAAYDLSNPDSISLINAQIAQYLKLVYQIDTPSEDVRLYRTSPSGKLYLNLPEGFAVEWWSNHMVDAITLHLSQTSPLDKRYRLNIPTLDRNLGSILGFRPTESKTNSTHLLNNQTDKSNPASNKEYLIYSNSGIASFYPNFDSLNYVFLCLNDFQHSQSSDNVISCNNQSASVDYPDYQKHAAYVPIDPTSKTTDPTTPNEIAVPTLPFSLTKAQLFTLNAIRLGKEKLPTQLPDDNASKNVLAMIPLKRTIGTSNMKEIYKSASFSSSKRDYFGTVKIGRLEVSLTDERGMLIDLDGQDWSCVIMIESLYQF